MRDDAWCERSRRAAAPRRHPSNHRSGGGPPRAAERPLWRAVVAGVLGLAVAASAAEVTVAVRDEEGASGRVAAPVAVEVELPEALLAAAKAGRLALTELGVEGAKPCPAQFEPEAADAPKGTLWWLMPEGAKGPRRFRLGAAEAGPKGAMTARFDKETQRVELAEGEKPVLRYNYGTVPVPEGVGGPYAVARSDYIHPLYGPAGEVLTQDFSKDHPHHRGIYWAWPEVAYKGRTLDLHALQGVFARPVRLLRTEGGPVMALLAAESRWMWDDKEPIVAEVATIRAFAATGGARFVDLEFQFTALVDGVTVARRGQKAYGGFSLRFSARKDQKIVQFADPAGAEPRKSWGVVGGVPPEATTPIGVAILEHVGNPRYPGDWVSYPNLNWLQPTFPSQGEKFPLSKDQPLRLRYRLWVHPGAAAESVLADLWAAYNRPPR